MAGAHGRSSIGATRKASLGMQRKSSVAGGARGSTLMGRIADPRNVSDKAFMNASIRQLIDYLTQNQFDHAISPKILTRPAVKDFNNIVFFLFQQIDPNFVCTGNFGDEVVSMFKHLRYPFQISKTNLVAVGSPTAWPALLAAVMWLIELLNYDCEAVAQYGNQTAEAEVGGDEPSSSEKTFFTYLSNAYGCFLGGDDEAYAELESQFVNTFESVNDVISAQLAGFEEKNRVLSDEIGEMDARRAFLPELAARKKDYQHDHGKFKLLIEQLVSHQSLLMTKKTDRTAEVCKLDAAIVAAQADIASLKEKVAHQELSPEDVLRMTERKDKLQEQLEAAGEAKSMAARKTWEAEMSLREKIMALDASCGTYNTLAEELKLAPHTAKFARGKNLSIEIDIRAKKRTGLVKTSITADVVPVLRSTRAEFARAVTQHKLDESELQDRCDELESKLGESEEAKAVLDSKVRRAEDSYSRERETLEAAMAGCEKEMDDMERRLAALRDCTAEEARSSAASRRAAEARAARDARRTQHKRMKREIQEAVMEIVTQCANHREIVQTKLEDMRGAYGSLLEELLDGASQGLGELAELAAAAPPAPAPREKSSRLSSLKRPSLGGAFARVSATTNISSSVDVEDIVLEDDSSTLV